MSAIVNPEASDEDVFPDELRPGTELLHGQYVIEKFLNSGGFGITYLAKDSLDRTVVIKECFPGSFCRRTNTIVTVRSRAHQGEFQSIVKLFVQEAKNLAKLKHPNIVGVHQIFEDNDTAYMVLDYINGRDLLDILDDPNDGLTPAEIQSITRKLLSAIDYIHKAGVLHRDISPDNILIDRKTSEPMLIDFGAAREEATRQTRILSAMRVVKDGYSPQEFYIQGSQQTPSSDLYALAATIYHVISGECPPDSQARLAAVAAQKLDPFRGFPSEVAGYDQKFLKAINQAMNIFPYDRIQTAKEWLEYIKPTPEVVSLPSAQEVRPRRPSRPTSVLADPTELADHAAAGGSAAVPGLPVPAMLPATSPDNQLRDPREEKLSSLRSAVPENTGRSNTMAFLMGGVAAAVVLAAAGAVFLLPEGTFFGQTIQAPAEIAQSAPAERPAEEVAPAAVEDIAQTAPAAEADPSPAPKQEITEEAAPTFFADLEPPATVPPQDLSTTGDIAVSKGSVSFADPNAINALGTAEASEAVEAAVAEQLEFTQPEAAEAAQEEPILLASLDAATMQAKFQAPAAFGDIVPVKDTAPVVYASAEFDVLTEARLFSILQQTVDAEIPPRVDNSFPFPMAAVAGTQGPVGLGWTVELPFEASPEFPSVIASIGADAPEWMRPGQTIMSVNGHSLPSIADIPALVSASGDLGAGEDVVLQLQIQNPDETTISTHDLSVSPTPVVELKNGYKFAMRLENGEWQTVVIESPSVGASTLKNGDRLVAYIPTNERLNRQNALGDILERELGNGVNQFAFAVNRDGQLWVASLGYSGTENE